MSASRSSRRVVLDVLADLVRQPDFAAFREHFERALSRPIASGAQERLRAIGAQAFSALLKVAEPDRELIAWFAHQYDSGNIEATEHLAIQLAKLSRELRQRQRREQYGDFDQSTTVVRTKRVVQLSWFGFAGWQSSDAFEIRRSVFKSPQERTFTRALRERFPQLVPLPNYPLDQICDLARLRKTVGEDVWRYGLLCRLDAVLITPIEGDPIAAFELDSRLHDDPEQQRRDGWKDRLLALANVPLYRLRSEDPQATTAEEWYQLLTEEVAHKVNVADRMRNRDVHSMLVPLVR